MGLADRADQRTVGTLSTLDGADNVGLLSIANAAGCAATVERVRFTRGKYRGFYKEGNGDLTLDTCEIVANGRTQTATSGRGAYFTGSSATVTATNCAFVGNLGTVVASDSPAGGAIYAGSLRRLVIDGTTFLSNGVPLEVGSSGHGSYSCYNGHSGAAIYATTAPVTARNCTFRGKGYIDETTGIQTATYQHTTSPALDAGDPLSPCGREPSPNGRCVNLGFYGNTPWATFSKGVGLMIILK